MNNSVIKKRLVALREIMNEYNLAAYFVPGTDPHMSEYVPAHWQRREWISGFTGSNGDILVTTREAGLWTDGRYFLQAETQLTDTGITLVKQGIKDEVSIAEWLKKKLHTGETVGVDPKLLSSHKAHELMSELEKSGISITWLEDNLIDRIWTDRPPLPEIPFVPHPLEYAGKSTGDKLRIIRKKMQAEGAEVYVVNTLDSLAWLFNIRGRDIEYNPVVIAYALITLEAAYLFVRPSVLTPAVLAYLEPFVNVRAYAEFKDELRAIAQERTTVWFDPAATNYWIETLLKDECQKDGCETKDKIEIIEKEDPLLILKAVKNGTEISGFKRAHIRDGVAMVKFLAWLEHTTQSESVTELAAQDRLLQFRREQELFQFPSFSTIAAYGGHGAIIHYNSSPDSDVQLLPTGLFLLDSGGQYLDGTTDITRTVSLGQITHEEQEFYTLVLKGYIQLATTIFPEGTKGIQLDALARRFLWERGTDYGHGTGHGVGSFLNVHEGPQSISAARKKQTPLQAGMCISLEPGYYRSGKFGIRLENLAVIVRNEKHSSAEQTFYQFEIVSLCPFDRRLIITALLTAEERSHIDEYHRRVYANLAPFLAGGDLEWLKAAVRPL